MKVDGAASVAPFGDAALTLALPRTGDAALDARRARRLGRELERARLGVATACVVGYGEVVVHLRDDVRAEDARAQFEELFGRTIESFDDDDDDAPAPRIHEVHAIYDGPDLDAVAEACALDRQEVIARHSAVLYCVEILGFLPGFAYLGGLDPALHVGRRASPRPRVEALSIGIAGARTAIYPSASPGGWHLLGRAIDVTPFDARRAEPALFSPGDRVRFIAQQGASR